MLYKFPPYPKDDQIHRPRIDPFNRIYQFHLGRNLENFPRPCPNLVIKTDHGAWVANTDYHLIKVPHSPTDQDDPTEFMEYKRLLNLRWLDTETDAVFAWIKQLSHWIELD